MLQTSVFLKVEAAEDLIDDYSILKAGSNASIVWLGVSIEKIKAALLKEKSAQKKMSLLRLLKHYSDELSRVNYEKEMYGLHISEWKKAIEIIKVAKP